MVEQARIVIIGGGIAGCSALYHLVKMGCTDVILLERDELTSGSTWHAAGNVPTYSTSWSIMQVQKYSAELYRQLAQDQEFPISYHVTGSVRLAHSNERMAEFRHVKSMARANHMEYEMLSPSELVDRYPLIKTHDLVGALWDPLDGDIDPSQVTQAMARAARELGAQIFRNRRVTGLRQHQNHNWTVTTLVGDVESEIECQIVINAAGYRAGEVMQMIGRHLPIMTMAHQYLITEEITELSQRQEKLPLLRDPDTSYYLRQERNGFILGPYEYHPAPMWLDGIPDKFANMLWPDELDRLEQQILDAGERVPVLGQAGIAKVVNGPIPYSPDGNPYLGPERGLRNFFHCNTFSFGIAQGGGAGKAIAEWVLNGRPGLDLWAIDRRRFKQFATTQYTIDRAVEVYQNEYAMGFPFEERPAGRPAYVSPLNQKLMQNGAQYGARGGWERPTYFDKNQQVSDHSLSFFRRNGWREVVAEEVFAARNGVAILDLPGFTKIEVSGTGAFGYLDNLLCTKLPRVGRISLVYALLPDGKVLSEFTVARVAENSFYLVGAASSEWHDLDVLEMALPTDGSVQLKNVTADFGSLILVGPRSRDVLSQVSTAPLDNKSFPWLSTQMIDTCVGQVRALRVNYVGELGWELHARNDQMVGLYDAIIQAGKSQNIRDIGIYAVDSLRLDKCYRGWKGDLEIGFSPFDASLDRFVDLTKPSFIGRDALLAEKARGSAYRFVPMTLDQPGQADAPYCASVFSRGKRIGIVTSSGWSFTLGKSIALAYLRPEFESPGTQVEIEIFGELVAATVGSEPLFDQTNERLKS